MRASRASLRAYLRPFVLLLIIDPEQTIPLFISAQRFFHKCTKLSSLLKRILKDEKVRKEKFTISGEKLVPKIKKLAKEKDIRSRYYTAQIMVESELSSNLDDL